MTSEESKLVDLLRKLDPVTENKGDEKKEATVKNYIAADKPTTTDKPDPNSVASTAVSNDTAQALRSTGGTGVSTQAAGDIAQDRYKQTGALANKNINNDTIQNSDWENYNKRSYDDTLNMSRLANAFNAQRAWFAPTLKPMSRGGEGGGYSLNIVQNPQLNTEEQQAMAINRGLAGQRGAAEVERQNRSRNIPVSIEEAIAKGTVDRGVQRDMLDLGMSQQMINDVWNKMYNGEYSQNFQERIAQYMSDLKQYETQETSKQLLDMYAKNPILATMTAQAWGTQMPSFDTWITQSNIARVLQDSGISPDSPQAYQLFNITSYSMAMDAARDAASAATGMATNAIAGLHTGVVNRGVWQ